MLFDRNIQRKEKEMFYVPVILDDAAYNAVNQSIKKVLICIGKEVCQSQTISDEEAYKIGVSSIDKQLNRFNKRALYRLIQADCVVHFGYEMEMTRKYIWRIHRIKAPKLMRTIRQRAEAVHSQEIAQCFSTLYSQLCKYGVEDRGDSIIGFPYYSTVNAHTNNVPVDQSPYSKDEIKALHALCREIMLYKGIYNRT